MKKLRITVDGKAFDVSVEMLDDQTASRPAAASVASAPVASAPVSAPPAAAPAPAAAPSAGAGDVPSPLAGKIVSLEVKVGDTVNQGDQLMTMEAMKMNTLIFAPASGTVKAILVNVGDGVQEGQPLCTLG